MEYLLVAVCGVCPQELSQWGHSFGEYRLSILPLSFKEFFPSCFRERPAAVFLSADGQGDLPHDCCRRLKQDPRTRNTPVLMLSRENDPDAALKAFGSGADDFLSTPCDPRVLAAHVLACSRRYLRAPPRVLRAGRLLIDPSHFSVTFGGRPVRLTPTEFLILEQLARQPGSVVRRQGILDQVRKFFDASLSHTLDTHICNIRRKLGPGNGRVIETVAGIGYRLNVP